MVKYISYDDGIIDQKIYAVEGHEWNTLDRYTCRIFAEKREEYRGGPKRLYYFPQIDDNEKETIYLIEPEPNKGFRKLAEAKTELERKMRELEIIN